MWGVLSRKLSRSTSMIDADSVKQLLEEELRQPSMRSWIGGSVNVFILRKFRNWKEHHDRHCPVSLDTKLLTLELFTLNCFGPSFELFRGEINGP